MVPVIVGAEGVRIETTDNQQELFIVVDTDDNVLGYKTRYECHHDNTLIHRGINVVIFDDQGRVLLQKRSMTKDTNPGLWAVSVGGHVTKGDTYEQAAAREMKEELGIEVPLTFHSKFVFSSSRETGMESLFTAQSNGPFIVNKEEIADVAFFAKDELLRKLLSKEIVLTKLAYETLKKVGFLS
jgi:isopentenyl-diphosphate delta-isomerase